MYNKITIDICKNIPDSTVEYIADCWAEFVTQDLNFDITDLPMTIYENESRLSAGVVLDGTFNKSVHSNECALHTAEIAKEITNVFRKYGYRGTAHLSAVAGTNLEMCI